MTIAELLVHIAIMVLIAVIVSQFIKSGLKELFSTWERAEMTVFLAIVLGAILFIVILFPDAIPGFKSDWRMGGLFYLLILICWTICYRYLMLMNGTYEYLRAKSRIEYLEHLGYLELGKIDSNSAKSLTSSKMTDKAESLIGSCLDSMGEQESTVEAYYRRVEIYILLAKLYRMIDWLDNTERFLRKAESIVTTKCNTDRDISRNTSYKAKVLFWFAELNQVRGNLDSALEYYKISQGLFRQINDTHSIVKVSNQIRELDK